MPGLRKCYIEITSTARISNEDHWRFRHRTAEPAWGQPRRCTNSASGEPGPASAWKASALDGREGADRRSDSAVGRSKMRKLVCQVGRRLVIPGKPPGHRELRRRSPRQKILRGPSCQPAPSQFGRRDRRRLQVASAERHHEVPLHRLHPHCRAVTAAAESFLTKTARFQSLRPRLTTLISIFGQKSVKIILTKPKRWEFAHQDDKRLGLLEGFMIFAADRSP